MTDVLARVWALIAQESAVSTSGGTDAYLFSLCAAAVRSLPASGAAVSVMMMNGARGLVIASDRTSQLMAELQVTLGEGPVIDAYALRRPVLEPELSVSAMSRWPSFAPAALEAGIQAAFAFPLQVGAARLGVLDVHRAEPGSLAPTVLKEALTYAQVAVLTLLDGQWDAESGSGPRGLERAMEDQSVLYQAQGMIKVQLGVSLADAMARLRAHAYATEQRLSDVAHQVVQRRLRLDPDPSAADPDLPSDFGEGVAP